MPYDQSLDKELFKESKEFDGTRVTVGVFQYNEGEKKLQIVRENRTQSDEWRFAKVGRMTKAEVEEVIPVLTKAVEHM